MGTQVPRERPLIAFFDYPDVFEDFYLRYGVDQRTFATRWASSGSNHAFISLLQREVGDVVWYTFSLAPTLSEAQHEVVGCRVKFLPSSWLHRCLWRSFYLPKAGLWRRRRLWRAFATVASYVSLASLPFIRTLLRDRPDVFFVQSYSSGKFDILLLIARLLGVPLIAYHAGGRPEEYLGRVVRRWTLPRADCIIASSRDELEMLAGRYRVPRERLVVILTPIDMSTLRPIDRTIACQGVGLDPARRYLLFVGRLEEVKRVSAIIRAFAAVAANHRGVDLLIVGDGSEGKMLRQLAVDCAPGRIRFVGLISEVETKVQLYNTAECLVLASRREGFPTVVGEAMGCGTPVLSSRVGGVGELVVEGQTGWLFAPGDNEALAAGLSFVAAHPEVVASMRGKVRSMAESRLSPDSAAAALRKCFDGVRRPHD